MINSKNILLIIISLISILLSGCEFIYGVTRTAELTQPSQQQCLITTLNTMPELKKDIALPNNNFSSFHAYYSTNIIIPSETKGLVPIYYKEAHLPLEVVLSFQEPGQAPRVTLKISTLNRAIPPKTVNEIINLMYKVQAKLDKKCHITSFKQTCSRVRCY